jgi:hypothetical protein
MKVTIDEDGYMIVEPEDTIEAYALAAFSAENGFTKDDAGCFKNIVICGRVKMPKGDL